MRSLLTGRPELDDPLYSQKNPYQTFLLVFSIIAAVPLLQGRENSGLLDRELAPSAYVAWGVVLLIGSATALIGQFWPWRTWSGLIVERFGLALVGLGAGVYGWVVWTSAANPDDVLYLAGIQAGYACSCAWRCWQISARLRYIKMFAETVGAPPRGTYNGGKGEPPRRGGP